jgi:hypothetical protein
LRSGRFIASMPFKLPLSLKLILLALGSLISKDCQSKFYVSICMQVAFYLSEKACTVSKRRSPLWANTYTHIAGAWESGLLVFEAYAGGPGSRTLPHPPTEVGVDTLRPPAFRPSLCVRGTASLEGPASRTNCCSILTNVA